MFTPVLDGVRVGEGGGDLALLVVLPEEGDDVVVLVLPGKVQRRAHVVQPGAGHGRVGAHVEKETHCLALVAPDWNIAMFVIGITFFSKKCDCLVLLNFVRLL